MVVIVTFASSLRSFGTEKKAQTASSDRKLGSNCLLSSLKLIRNKGCRGASPAITEQVKMTLKLGYNGPFVWVTQNGVIHF